MGEVGEIPIEESQITPEVKREIRKRLIISTDITSGAYFGGIKEAPQERDDGLALFMIRTATKDQKLNPLFIMSIFTNNGDGRTSYNSLSRVRDAWGEGIPPIAQGAVEARKPNLEAVQRVVELLSNSPEPITLVGLGAFTDFAEVVRLAKEKGLAEKISEIVITAPAEDVEGQGMSFNTKQDRAALDYLRDSGQTLLYDWGGVLEHGVTREMVQVLEKSTDPLAKFVSEGLETRNRQLQRLSAISRSVGRNLPGVLPESEKRDGKMCIQDMIVPIYLTRPELFERTKTQYGYRVSIKDHRGVNIQVNELLGIKE
ncbi:MAG: hypothetical protein UT17_C0002G0180 [Candidatus Woesebacteria bacterium GW2011_GWB1_39_10]|uniref:Uncharacterized protein n=3 Tax=Candidatus Woeseibacteriota TaxID=1752722 RepID=A0A0G0UUM7_9BACT|nr:MAG: hypothetical protein UT17_C0002G0180 [Candidatus Woesebacteria bacterium GW2011_GWB1_39_10]KKR92469.1 MAG: hypothetical protein UU42_C0001G0073 [Candidatus Woesebacteria bacterium GW2011_GWA1_41_13b]